jgi:hypothetical protein
MTQSILSNHSNNITFLSITIKPVTLSVIRLSAITLIVLAPIERDNSSNIIHWYRTIISRQVVPGKACPLAATMCAAVT